MKLPLRTSVVSVMLCVMLTSLLNTAVAQSALPLGINIGKDTLLPLKQSGPTEITLTAKIAGIPVAVKWVQLKGAGGAKISGPSLLSTTITGLTTGFYTFRCDVLDIAGISLLSDVINVTVVDYQQKNRVPCRTGAPKTFVLSATNTTDLMKPYLRRDGMDIQGGDTIKINRNPNNGGKYRYFYLGDFGGDEGCPVIVVPNGQVVEIGGPSHRWHLGQNINNTSDSNFVNHAVIDGTYLEGKGIKYGFQSTGTGWGLSTTMVTDLEIKGVLFENNSLGMQMKVYSDSTYGWTVYDNFIMKNIKIHDNYFHNITGTEGMYIGHTSQGGTTQAGNDGPTLRMDSVFLYNNFIDSTGWDPMQTSSARYVEMHDNVIMHAAGKAASSQDWGLLLGGNCTGKVYNNILYKGTSAAIGVLGYGQTDVYYNFVGSTTATGIYVNGISTDILEANIPGMFPQMKLTVRDNILSAFENRAIFHANNNKRALPGMIKNNYVIDATKTLAQTIVTNAADAMTDNKLVKSFPVEIRNVGAPRTGFRIEIKQGNAIDTFNTAKEGLDWLFARLNPTATPNVAPVAQAGSDQLITLPASTVTLDGSASKDNDGTIISYGWSKQPAAVAVIQASGSAQTKITGLQEGEYQFFLAVTDNGGLTGFDTVRVTVKPAPPIANVAPVAKAGNDQEIRLPVNSVNVSASLSTDSDGQIASYAWSRVNGPAGFNIGDAAAAETTISQLVAGTYHFRLVITDDDGASTADTIQINVLSAIPVPNKAPVAKAGNDQVITLPVSTVTLDGSASTDNDGTIVSYSWSQLPAAVAVIQASGSAQTKITGLQEGEYQFLLVVTDNGGLTDIDTVRVTVKPVPSIPNVAPAATAGNDQEIRLPVNTVQVSASLSTDSDGRIASYAWSRVNGPAGFNIADAASAETTISQLVAGTYTFRVVVTDDNGASTADTIQINVLSAVPAPNKVPVANAGADQGITLPASSVNLSAAASVDPDGELVSYQWSKIAGPGSYNFTNSANAETTVTNLAAGSYSFRVLVTDNDGETGADTVNVIVNAAAVPPPPPPPVNIAPIANGGTDKTITLPANTVILSGLPSTDPDGSIEKYSWSKVGGPASYGIGSPNSMQTVISGLAEGAYAFQLEVADNSGATDRDTIRITVKAASAPNTPPVADAGDDQSLTLPTDTVTLISRSSDPDGSIVSYQWLKTGGPAKVRMTNENGSVLRLENLAEGVYSFTLIVTDNKGATANDNVTVSVDRAANIPPVANAGDDLVVLLPISNASLKGTATDADGTIVRTAWSIIEGQDFTDMAGSSSLEATISGLREGKYTLELKAWDNQGASSADTMIIRVRGFEASAASVFPNPASGNIQLKIDANTATSPTSIVIYDLTQKVVFQERFIRNEPTVTKSIDISSLPAGVYFVVTTVDLNHRYTSKLVKQ